MPLYHVMQYPKPKYRTYMVTLNVIVEAATITGAIHVAIGIGAGSTDERWFCPSPHYCAPKAKALKTGVPFTT